MNSMYVKCYDVPSELSMQNFNTLILWIHHNELKFAGQVQYLRMHVNSTYMYMYM